MRILRLVTALGFCCGMAFADAVAEPTITPVQAELMAGLHARLLSVGGTVYARVTADWKGTDCVLRSGAILEAQVLAVVPQTKTARGSEVSLAFTKAQCRDVQMNPFALMLSAMASPPTDSDLGVLGASVPILTSPVGNGMQAYNSLRAGTDEKLQLQASLYLFPRIPNMRMGEVYGIRGLKLSVGTGPDNSSVVSAKDRDVALEKHTLLLLVPAKGAFPREMATAGDTRSMTVVTNDGGGNPVSAGSATTAPPAKPAVNELDNCVPPECSLVGPSDDVADSATVTGGVTSASIQSLGYSPRPQRKIDSFDHDEALAYLGPRELLVAFNPHILVKRHSLGRSGSTVRVIRAALMNTETRQFSRTVDWELPDNRQYLWPLADGRVLVHVASELRVYGEGLKILTRIPLDGPLAFVRVTPDGSFFAVGVMHERHSAELHAKLVANNDGEPEEDVEIEVLNSSFEKIAKTTAPSGLMTPTLLNEGQAQLKAQPNMHYRIAMQTWDNRAETVARFKSGCTPELSSISPDLIFLVSCDSQTAGRAYRVIRPDGKLLLKGDSTLNELGHSAEGSANHMAFVVKIVTSKLPATSGSSFSASDLSSEEFGVYRAPDGKRLLNVRVASPSPSHDGYALSPDGSQLAVLTLDKVAVYSVPQK